MACDPQELRHVPLFALLDDEEAAVLAAQVELRRFAPRQRIYKIGDPGNQAYVMMSGSVRVTTVDEDHQEVVVDQPGHGDFFGFASMLEQTPHQTNAIAMEETYCLEVDRNDSGSRQGCETRAPRGRSSGGPASRLTLLGWLTSAGTGFRGPRYVEP
jgi:CRP/FNR family transcriptional regulator, cyclic AMP receptor protein